MTAKKDKVQAPKVKAKPGRPKKQKPAPINPVPETTPSPVPPVIVVPADPGTVLPPPQETKQIMGTVSKTLAIPAVVSALTFATNVAQTLADGSISTMEMQHLINGESGLTSLILGGLMYLFRKK